MSCAPWATTSTGSATQWSAPVPPRPASRRSIGSDPMWSSSTDTSRTSMAWMSSSVYGPGRVPSFSSPIREILRRGRAMQLGAEHVVAKPVDLNHLAAVTARVCDKVRLMRQNVLLREALEQLLSTPRPGKAREIWKAVEHLPADLRRGGGGGDGGGGGGGGVGGDGATSPRRSLRCSGCTSRRRFGSTAATARGRPRSSAFRARR